MRIKIAVFSGLVLVLLVLFLTPSPETDAGATAIADPESSDSASTGGVEVSTPPAAPPHNVPVYDMEAWCESVSQASGGSYVIRSSCLEQERRAREAMIRAGMVEGRIRDWCDQVARSAGTGSYNLYQSCVEREVRARSEG